MKTVKALVHVADWDATVIERCTIRSEIVARFGKKQKTMRAYEPNEDIEVILELKFVDWWNRSEVSPLYICPNRLRKSLEAIGLYPL